MLFQSSFQSVSEFVSPCRILHEKLIHFKKRLQKIQTRLSFVIQSCMLKVANNNLVPSFSLYLILLDVMCFFPIVGVSFCCISFSFSFPALHGLCMEFAAEFA